jgi:hypothetical protein
MFRNKPWIPNKDKSWWKDKQQWMSRHEANVIVRNRYSALFTYRLASVQSIHSMLFLKTTTKLMKQIEKHWCYVNFNMNFQQNEDKWYIDTNG